MLYLVPDTGSVDQLTEIASRTQIPLHNPKNLREFILQTATDPLAIVAVSEELMLVMTRHATSIFPEELPVVLHNVPGLIYQAGWASMGTAFPPAHFRDFAEMTKRSGVLSTTPEALESRGVGARALDPREISSMSDAADAPAEGEYDDDQPES